MGSAPYLWARGLMGVQPRALGAVWTRRTPSGRGGAGRGSADAAPGLRSGAPPAGLPALPARRLPPAGPAGPRCPPAGVAGARDGKRRVPAGAVVPWQRLFPGMSSLSPRPWALAESPASVSASDTCGAEVPTSRPEAAEPPALRGLGPPLTSLPSLWRTPFWSPPNTE
ncbi:translation initiation factor IF-2 [Bubalus bubalis]|uniref:translation initiation factor IF-2 n=1 Tax=Bubalus bubalis TaxID=89462 RepID=UPI000DBC5247|nr:translation initiation factor IF-2 [Bubalus bubalis]